MAHTDQSEHTMRRVLRREIAGTIGLLTDEHDFRAMRRYRSFTFHDHAAYLRQVEALLRARAAQGTHTTIALFDPEEYADYCTAAGLDADAPASRSRYTAELAAHGPTVRYEGQSLADLLPALVDEAVRQATWEYTAGLLARLGSCATCGEDLGRAAFARASRLLHRVLETAPPGNRHLVCSVSGHPAETLVSVLLADEETDGTPHIDETEVREFTSVLALGLATHSPGGLVMRISPPSGPERIHGWRLRGYGLEPLTAGEVFDAYCTDVESGDLISPESNVDYCAPPDLGEDHLPPGHHH
ncbi:MULTISPECIES: thioredoxin domain-containing protein [Streptomyces]|uniref:Uncharacterized protein n=1 Tax=Streptomyces lienomycini TaxID=284035 RepID=A0ABV9X4F9_9ACTN|nr:MULTISPECIES: hypothetical protein [Streptomyces]